MANGDAAEAAGFDTVPPSGDGGKVKMGYDEINKTRDYVANVKTTLDSRIPGTITRGTTDPLNTVGNDGDIYLKMV